MLRCAEIHIFILLTASHLYPSTDHPSLDPACLSLSIQVQSNDPDARYVLVQKERELKFPFEITQNGEIMVTEKLDRESKERVDNTFVQ